jgi:RHS repeat-associated protein
MGSVTVVGGSRQFYDAFGNMKSTGSGAPAYWWQGLRMDPATGLVRDGERMEDPATGKFLTRDPMYFAAGDPNLYRRVHNEPTNATAGRACLYF